MWQLTPHALQIEQRTGYDALPVIDGSEWWARVRHGADGNWQVANGIHRGFGDGDQGDFLWDAFYDQSRGEIEDSDGWFPNGEAVREWWAPSAMREIYRRNGRRSVVFQLSDWWQYDSFAPKWSFATAEHFNQFLAHNAGKIIAGK
jgi:hypothetical protein